MKNFIKTNFIILTFALQACTSANNESLPILGPFELINKEVDGVVQTDTVHNKIPKFTFLNQDSVEITERTFENSIYIADFFFTSCPSICPTMHRNMLKVYEKYKGNEEVMFLSHSIDTKYDVPSVLHAYAEKLGVLGNQWQFATGTREAIYGISDSYMVLRPNENQDAPGGFEHQGWFILVDKNKHIRGAYDGTNDEQVAELLKDIPILLAEYQ